MHEDFSNYATVVQNLSEIANYQWTAKLEKKIIFSEFFFEFLTSFCLTTSVVLMKFLQYVVKIFLQQFFYDNF